MKIVQGIVVINYQYDEKTEKCSWTLRQEGQDTLQKDDLILLFRHIIEEYMTT